MIRAFQQRAEQKISGFQSPAADYLEGRLDIGEAMVVDPHATFYFQMDSPAMEEQGLKAGDILVVDRSLEAVEGAIVVAFVADGFFCRRYALRDNRPVLCGDRQEIIQTTDGEVLQVWGVVISICRNTLPEALRKGRYRRVCAL
jgi:DNA polymerase V